VVARRAANERYERAAVSLDHLVGVPGPLKSMKATVPTGVKKSYFS
jgi:hypothetical protein